MSEGSKYQISITITNEAGETIRKVSSVPTGTRPWKLLQHDNLESIVTLLMSQLKSGGRVFPGWLNKS